MCWKVSFTFSLVSITPVSILSESISAAEFYANDAVSIIIDTQKDIKSGGVFSRRGKLEEEKREERKRTVVQEERREKEILRKLERQISL